MRSHYFVISLFSLVLGCSDNPYTEPKAYMISGVVDIGSPVTGAAIKAYAWQDGKKGDELGSTTADDNGNFSLNLSTRHHGPILLFATAGSYTDPASKQKVTFTEKDALRFFLPKPQEQNSISFNAWTTVASARAIGTLGKYGSAEEAMQKSLSAIEQHLGGLKLSSKTCDIFAEECQADSQSLLFTLSHLGLSQIAKNNSVSFMALINLVADDISDGALDGKKNDEVLFLDASRGLLLDSHLIGFELAKAINQFLTNIAVEKPDLIQKLNPSLTGEHGFYAKISKNKNTELFPESKPEKVFVGDEGVVNVVFDLGSSFYRFENDPKDLGFKEYTTLDVFNFNAHPVLKDGFVFAHAVVTNLMNQPVTLRVSEPAPNLYMLARHGIWHDKRKQVADKALLCLFDSPSEYGPEPFPLATEGLGPVKNYVYPHFFEFATATGQVGSELQASAERVVSIAPKQTILIKWSTDVKKVKTTPLLPKGQFPSDATCPITLNREFAQLCGQTLSDTYILDRCSGFDEGFGRSNYVQYQLVKGFEVSLREHRPFLEYSLTTQSGKQELRRAYANGPLRSITR